MKKLIIPTSIAAAFFLILTPIFSILITNLHPIVLIVLFLCIFAAVTAVCLLAARAAITVPRKLMTGCYVLYTLALIILLFMRPNEQNYGSVNLIPFETISFYLSGEVHWVIAFYNLAANIGLFIPYGILLRLVTAEKRILTFLPFLPITIIEISQHLTRRGSLDIDDLILNVSGFYIGYALFPLFRKIINIK